MPDGTVKGWGSNVFNALNLGKDLRDQATADRGAAARDAVPVAGGQNHGCAVLKDGTATCWGTPARSCRHQIEGAADQTAIAARAYSDDTCAITKAKKVTCWDAYDLKPEEVAGLDDVTALSGRSHWCASKGDGTVWCWGDNDLGQLGNGTVASAASRSRSAA